MIQSVQEERQGEGRQEVLRFSLAHLRRRCIKCHEWRGVYGGVMLGAGKGYAKRFKCAGCR